MYNKIKQIEIMKNIQEVIENLKDGKSAYECMRICQSAKTTVGKDELSKLQEMTAYYGGVNEELQQLDLADLYEIKEDVIE